MTKLKRFGAVAAPAVAASTLTFANPVSAHTTGIHDNCTALDRDNDRIACEKR